MVRRWIVLSAIFAALGFALAGCAGNSFSRGYYAGGYPYVASGGYGPAHRVLIHGPPIKPRAALRWPARAQQQTWRRSLRGSIRTALCPSDHWRLS
jgi:hypothetical protein